MRNIVANENYEIPISVSQNDTELQDQRLYPHNNLHDDISHEHNEDTSDNLRCDELEINVFKSSTSQ